MKPFLFVITCSLLALLGRAAERPNILWITAEDMGRDLGCYGDRYSLTPNIDRFAQQSIRYTRAFAESPMCAPSRSALITGMHTGPLGTSQMRSNHPVPKRVRGFPAWLREAGYYCANNVKTDYNVGDEAGMIRDAWDESSKTAHWRSRPADKPFFCVLNYMDTHQSRASRDDYETFRTNVQSRLSQADIHNPAQAPLAPWYPDTPTVRRTVARYYDCITTLDQFVAKTLADLEADGLAENTIVFLFSDHGAGMPGAKAAAFAQGLRVPLMVRFPAKFRHLAPAAPGTVSDRIVSFVDFGPTVLNLAGLPTPAHMDGKPFLGERLPAPRQFAHGTRDRLDEVQETTRWISDGRYHLVRSYDTRPAADQQSLVSLYNGNGEMCREIRALKAAGKLTAQQLRLWGDSREPIMLFDSENDPWCVTNLVNDPAHGARLTNLLAELESRLLRERDLGFWPEPERVAAEQGMSAWERARQPGVYPLERILATARLVGFGPGKRAELERALGDTDASVRYWAAVGLAALGNDVKPSLAKLRQAENDSAASVRIVAAETVARYGDPAESAEALALLVRELTGRDEWAACRAARALELLGERARPYKVAMREVLLRRNSGFFGAVGPDPAHYSLEFALRAALEKLDRQ